MAILDMQDMQAREERSGGRWGFGSDVSLLLCASEASVLVCL
jgi:hypothetical protein